MCLKKLEKRCKFRYSKDKSLKMSFCAESINCLVYESTYLLSVSHIFKFPACAKNLSALLKLLAELKVWFMSLTLKIRASLCKIRNSKVRFHRREVLSFSHALLTQRKTNFTHALFLSSTHAFFPPPLQGSVRRNSTANSKGVGPSANHRIADRDYLGWMDFGRRSAEEYEYSS